MKKIILNIIRIQIAAMFFAASLACSAAAEVTVPLRGTLSGVEGGEVQFPFLYEEGLGGGNATHLGRFTLTWEVVVNLETITGTGSAHFIAANGDELFTEFVGQATPTVPPDQFWLVEHFTITDGSGRFTGAKGKFIMERSVDLSTGLTAGSFEGEIILSKGK